MNKQNVMEISHNFIDKKQFNLCWEDNLSIQRLLDTISSIIAEEYISIAKQNPRIFINKGDSK